MWGGRTERTSGGLLLGFSASMGERRKWTWRTGKGIDGKKEGRGRRAK